MGIRDSETRPARRPEAGAPPTRGPWAADPPDPAAPATARAHEQEVKRAAEPAKENTSNQSSTHASRVAARGEIARRTVHNFLEQYEKMTRIVGHLFTGARLIASFPSTSSVREGPL